MIYLLSLIMVIFSLVSCTIKYLPIPTQHIVISDDFAVVKETDFTFAVENQYWIKNPQNLTDYFTTFYISVKNRTSEKMNIELGDVVLLDENGNQYDAVTIDYIPIHFTLAIYYQVQKNPGSSSSRNYLQKIINAK